MRKVLLSFLFILGCFSYASAQTAGDYLGRARNYLAQQEYERAIENAARALIINPRSPEAFALRGQAEANVPALMYLSYLDLSAAIGLDPKNASYHRLRASVHQQYEEYEEAIFDL